MIKGPGTVGIDTSGSLEDAFETVLEALDYYGIYSITRPISTLPDTSNTEANEDVVPEVVRDISPSEQEILKQLSVDFAEQPMEPDDVIWNRRISMGVYGVYSKFM